MPRTDGSLCRRLIAGLEFTFQHQLIERCCRLGNVFHQKLQALREFPAVGDIRGNGLLAGVEFVADRATKDAFPRSIQFAERFARMALDEGLTVWPNVGHADGTNGDLAMLAPPFIITEGELDEIVARFARALERTQRGH